MLHFPVCTLDRAVPVFDGSRHVARDDLGTVVIKTECLDLIRINLNRCLTLIDQSVMYHGQRLSHYRNVKAADKITAYIKCIREKLAGNTEFESAMATLRETIDKIDLPEVKIFMDEFIPPFGLTLDELNK